MTNCPICNGLLGEAPSRLSLQVAFNCERCGEFILTSTLDATLPAILDGNPKRSALLSHYIRRMHQGTRWPVLTDELANRIIENEVLPTPQEQAENIIRWLGNNLEGPGAELNISDRECGGIVGSIEIRGFQFVVGGLLEQRLISGQQSMDGNNFVTLTFEGWQKFEELRKGVTTGRRAFMAMPFGVHRIDRVVDECFRPVVEETGFVLTRVDDNPKAGLIDDRMRVEIQSSTKAYSRASGASVYGGGCYNLI